MRAGVVCIVMPLALACQPKPTPSQAPEPAAPFGVDASAKHLAEAEWNQAQSEPGPTIEEALASESEPKAETKPVPKERPKGLARPTDAEFRAWNRKDPAADKRLHEWDRANFKTMHRYFQDLQCFMRRARKEGEKAFGAEPGDPAETAWFNFKRAYVTRLDRWQRKLFADVPRAMEKSKFIGMYLEAHELAMLGFLRAYNMSDRDAVQKTDAHWLIVESKVRKYATSLGKKATDASKAHCKAMKLP